jgi:Fe-S-cluster-containing dehydrogenase component
MSFRFRIDVSRCIGCRACEVACVTANDLNPTHARNWVPHLEEDSSSKAHATFAPYLCAHCEDAPCVASCPTGASYKAEDGRVLVDKDLCIGCGLCVPSCPYEARFVEPISNKLDKCTLCEGRVQHGEAPACFDVCPAGARHFEETLVRDGEEVTVRVGDPMTLDVGTEAIALVTDDVDPKPRLELSGRPRDLALVRTKRSPILAAAIPSTVWKGGGGLLVQGLGAMSALAMASMVGLQALRRRKEKVAAAESSQPKPQSTADTRAHEPDGREV